MDNLRLFKNLILFANKSNKLGLLIYFFLSIICAFTEVISLGTVIPYITSIINPDLLENNKIFIFFLQNTNFDLKKQFVFLCNNNFYNYNFNFNIFEIIIINNHNQFIKKDWLFVFYNNFK